MGWNDRLGVGPGYSRADVNKRLLATLGTDSLNWILEQLKSCPEPECAEQLSAVEKILQERNQIENEFVENH